MLVFLQSDPLMAGGVTQASFGHLIQPAPMIARAEHDTAFRRAGFDPVLIGS